MTNDIMTASALTNLANIYSKCGLHSLAAENYRKAAELFHEGGDSESSQNCRCKWLLSEIGVAC